MTGLFNGIYIGTSSIQANQIALNTTAHNLANVDTNGYVRQQVLMRENAYQKVAIANNRIGQTGNGTAMQAVRHLRDQYLDMQIRMESGRTSFYKAEYQTLDEIGSYFGELEGTQFQNTLNDFSKSITQLKNNTSVSVNRGNFIENARALLERSQDIYGKLTTYQQNLNAQVKDTVKQINQYAKQIAGLNNQIAAAEQYTHGEETAKDMRDQRDVMLDELSKLIKIDYKERDGIVMVQAEGNPLVTEDGYNEMTTIAGKNNYGYETPVWKGSGNLEVYQLEANPSTETSTDIGALKGLLYARGDHAGTYREIPIEGTADYESKLASYNNQVKPYLVQNVQAQFDHLIHAISTSMNDILSPNTTVGTLSADEKAALGTNYTDAGGNTYKIFTDSRGNLIKLTDDTQILDASKAPYGTDGSQGTELFTRDGISRYTKVTVQVNGEDRDYYIYNEEEPDFVNENLSKSEKDVYQYSIENMSINSALTIQDQYGKLPLDVKHADSGYDNATVESLISNWEKPFTTISPMGYLTTGLGFDNYYKEIIGDLGSQGMVKQQLTAGQEGLVNQYFNQRQEATGVASDEEMSSMLVYQHAYSAASRYVTVLNSMLESIIGMI